MWRSVFGKEEFRLIWKKRIYIVDEWHEQKEKISSAKKNMIKSQRSPLSSTRLE